MFSRYRVLLLSSTVLLLIIGFIFIQKNLKSAPSVTHIAKQILPTSSYIPILPSVDQIFSDTRTVPQDSDRVTTLIVTGDVIPARSVNVQTLNRNNFLWAFEKTGSFLKNADITFVNLETPLLKKCAPTVEGMIFCGDSRHIQGLVYAGVDVVSLGNNHAGNYGEEGVSETIQLLQDKGIQVTGHSRRPIACPTGFSCGYDPIVIKDIGGIKFAFIGFNDITSPQPGVLDVDVDSNIESLIDIARLRADVVIVTYHWGVEYRSQPDDRQIELGHRTIDAGADLVIGNHPHWIQPIEIYQGKLITYAHGNFVFDQMWSQETREGVVGKYTFFDNQLIDAEYFPLQIDDYGQPHFLEGEEKKKILADMKKESEILQTKQSGEHVP